MNSLDEHIDLLYSDPPLFTKHCRELIETVIHYKLIIPGWFRVDEKDDLHQEVYRRLLEKIFVIRDQYRNEAKPSTYFSKVILNICFEICREKKRNCNFKVISIDGIFKEYKTRHIKDLVTLNEGEFHLYLSDAINRLNFSLATYNNSNGKVLLFFKLLYGIRIDNTDLENYCPDWNNVGLLNRIEDNSLSNKTNTERYQLINDIVNHCEGKHNNYDSIRKEINNRLDEIVNCVNGRPPIYSFDKESFRYLFEKYCEFNSN